MGEVADAELSNTLVELRGLDLEGA